MNHSIRKTALAAAVALPAALGMQTASAALITSWNYEIDSAFTDFTQTSGTGSVTGSENNTDEFSGEPTKLSWGTPSNPEDAQSSISVESEVDGSGLLTKNDALGLPGNSVDGATFTHDNNVITAASADLDTFVLSTRLLLTQEAPPGTGSEALTLDFNGFFNETVNHASLDDCVEGSTTACDDIFVIGNESDIAALNNGQSFIIDDYKYTVFLDIAGVGPLTDAQCAEADAPSGCVGFLTEEDTLNQFFTSVRIEATEIPAPGVLALLGVGLLGLGFTHRARRS